MTYLNFDYIDAFFKRNRQHSIKNELLAAAQVKNDKPHGDIDRWIAVLDELESAIADFDNRVEASVDDGAVCVRFSDSELSSDAVQAAIDGLHPWRKGPFCYQDNEIDTEWRSDWKYQRLADVGVDVQGRDVLDVGCGNGYFMFRMAMDGANSVLGVDPSWLFYCQFMLWQRRLRDERLLFLPLGVEAVPEKPSFDLILSMGVLYHRKSPLEHLFSLKAMLREGGELLLETIVLPHDLASQSRELLTPVDRYAGMRNVWFIPTVTVLCDWLEKTGFRVDAVGELVKTTLTEQRQTKDMTWHSLNQFLTDENTTIEGYAAPYRVMVRASVTS